MSVVQLNNSLPTPKPVEALADTLEVAKREGISEGLKYAGKVSPEDAWKLFVNGQAHLVDVRAAEERKFVGMFLILFMWLGKQGPHLSKTRDFYGSLKINFQKTL